MVKNLLSAILVAVSLVLSGNSIADEQITTSFEKKIERTLKLNFLLHLPENYEAEKDRRFPLMIFLHGAGERGDDLAKVKVHGPPKMVENGEDFPFILASPQCPKDSWWTEEPVLELVDYLEATYRVDPARIYLTGLSMGGYGTWHFATKAPERFAAIAPVCGGGAPYKMRWIKDLPVWAFHGAKDTVVPPYDSERLVEALEKQGNKSAKLTVYPEAGHDSWTATYANPELYRWFLSHSRNTH